MAEPVVRIEKPEPSIEMGTRMADALLKEVGPFDGVFFSNDLLAVGALSRWRSHGLAVPKDIAIVGFSDVAVAKATSPSLTTIRVDAREMGRIAGERLLERLCGATAPDRRVDVGVRLVQRASS